jgi:hypothetical protein
MRLTKQLATIATQELLSCLRSNPQGLFTRELVGSPKFHGHRTLSHYQIIKLLRASGEVTERWVGGGHRWSLLWKVKPLPSAAPAPETTKRITARKQKLPSDTEILALAQQAYASAVVIFTDLVSTQPDCADRKVVEPLALVAAGFMAGMRNKRMDDEEYEELLLRIADTINAIAEHPRTWKVLDQYIDSLAEPQDQSPGHFFEQLTPVEVSEHGDNNGLESGL